MSELEMFVSISAALQDVQFLVLLACRKMRRGPEIHQSLRFSSLKNLKVLNRLGLSDLCLLFREDSNPLIPKHQ